MTARGIEGALTHGAIAMRNLEAQIEGLDPDTGLHPELIDERVRLIDLLALRGWFIGAISDYERAQELAQQLVRDVATDARAFLARARTGALFHRFAQALDDLHVAERLAVDIDHLDLERAAVFQGLGRYPEALSIRAQAAERSPTFENLGALASLYAETGDIEQVLRLQGESDLRYRGVSPLPLAVLEFQIGRMWMHSGEHDRARESLSAACRYVPSCWPAQGHLAEVEAELGNLETAIALLRPPAMSSDDPDYAAQLARILLSAGNAEESQHWRDCAAARYEELEALHPEAFADHAAEFWLGVGADPRRGLRLARTNFTIRKTPRAEALLSRAVARLS